MNKLLSLLTLIAFCTVTTVMNGALPPGKEWREQAREVPRIRTTEGTLLPEPAVRSIQEYLVPRSVPVKIMNVAGLKLKFSITFEYAETGNQLSQFLLHSNPSTVGSLLSRRHYVGIKPGESVDEFVKRKAEEAGEFFQYTVNLPLIPLRIKIENPEWQLYGWKQSTYGYILLNPSDLEKIDTIGFMSDKVYLYTGEKWEVRHYSSE